MLVQHGEIGYNNNNTISKRNLGKDTIKECRRGG
jgi:hypothetical protein